MEIRPDEIGTILRERIAGLDVDSADLAEVGTVLSVADGIARVHGLDNCMSLEMLEFPHDVTGLALNLERENVGTVMFGEWDKVVEGDTVKRTGRLLEIPVGEELLGRLVDPLGRQLDDKGDIKASETRPAEFKAPGIVQRQPVNTTGPDRPQVDRRNDPDRPRPARADHRRPPDGEDRGRRRHDHQQQGQGPRVHLRRDRPAHVDRAPGDAGAGGQRRDGEHDHRRCPRRRGRADQVHRSVRGVRDGRALPLQRQGRAVRLRRPHQARLRLPADVAVAAAPSGP